MAAQTIKTPGGEILVVLSLDEFEDLCDAADHAKAIAARRPDEELFSAEEALAFAEAPTRLHFWLRKRGMTSAELATKADISLDYVASLEAGEHKGDAEGIKKLAAALGVAMEQLVED